MMMKAKWKISKTAEGEKYKRAAAAVGLSLRLPFGPGHAFGCFQSAGFTSRRNDTSTLLDLL